MYLFAEPLGSDNSPRPLVILGHGGFAREVLALVATVNEPIKRYQFLGFIDKVDGVRRHSVDDRALLGSDTLLETLDADYLVAIGSPRIRRRLDHLASSCGRSAATLVHPSATIGPGVHLGDGSIVTAGARITDNISIGQHVIVGLNATIGHDCMIGDYVTVSPLAAISGNVSIDDGVTVGSGSVIVQGVHIGAGASVGVGSVVMRDVPPGVTVLGAPAKKIWTDVDWED